MQPGSGTIDFVDLFGRLERAGFGGHYMCGWGSLDDMLVGRAYLLDRAREAEVA
jgi:sugar phosphate isomerase/epimerase